MEKVFVNAVDISRFFLLISFLKYAYPKCQLIFREVIQDGRTLFPKRMRLEIHCGPSAGVATPFTGQFIRPCPERQVPSDVTWVTPLWQPLQALLIRLRPCYSFSNLELS
jgi:hypothetical protein